VLSAPPGTKRKEEITPKLSATTCIIYSANGTIRLRRLHRGLSLRISTQKPGAALLHPAAPGCTGCTGCTGCIGHILHLLTPSFWPLLRNCRQIHLKTTYQIDLQTDANGKQSSTLASSLGTPHPGDLRPGTSARVHLPRHCLEIPTRMTLARGTPPGDTLPNLGPSHGLPDADLHGPRIFNPFCGPMVDPFGGPLRDCLVVLLVAFLVYP